MSSLFYDEPVPSKVCTKCKKDLPLTMYGKANGANYLRSECKKCNSKLLKERKRFKGYVAPKGHICPICKKSEEQCKGKGGKYAGTWCNDHNHKTGNFRGWLCHSCNRGLGAFEDDPEMLMAAIEYVTQEPDEIVGLF